MQSVGDTVDAYCLKCKLLLAHVVLFKVNGEISRVRCKTCGAEHKYRGATRGGKKAVAPRTAGVIRTKKTVAEKATASEAPLQWDLKSRNMSPETPVRGYSMRDLYKAGDVISHPVFGVGFVVRVLSDKSISVLFHDAVRLMGMNIA